jgi:membrane protein YdbS with pleckstrin-like domain
LLYENSRYHLNNEILFIKKSGVTSLESTIPLKRIQHVDIEQTLYSRFFNLYQLNIYTAGDKNNIGFIRKEEAESMKNDITEYLLGMSEEVDG